MLAGQELARLQSRKRELLAEGDRRRRAFQAAYGEVQGLLNRVDSMKRFFQRVTPLLVVSGALAGFLAVRRRENTGTLWSRLQGGWKLGRMAYGLWRGLSNARQRFRHEESTAEAQNREAL